jgi:hypothetical protein
LEYKLNEDKKFFCNLKKCKDKGKRYAKQVASIEKKTPKNAPRKLLPPKTQPSTALTGTANATRSARKNSTNLSPEFLPDPAKNGGAKDMATKMMQQKSNLKIGGITSGGGAKGPDGPIGSSRNYVASAKGTDNVSLTGNEKMKKVSSKRQHKETSAASGPQQSAFAEKRQVGDQDSISKLKAKNKKFEKVDRKDQSKKEAIKEK